MAGMKQLSIQKITEAFSFAISECARMHALIKAGERDRYRDESGLHGNLPAERGEFPHGHYPCSIVAIRRLSDVARARVESDRELRGRINLNSYFGPLTAELGVRCVRNREEVTEDLAKEILKAAKAAALHKVTRGVYFFPAYSVDELEGVQSYKLGAVTFERTHPFFERTAAEWENSISGNIADWTAEARARGQELDAAHIRANYAQLREHFTGHAWMASVSIDGAEDDIGYTKAERVIDQTFTLIRLWVPSWRDSFVGLSIHRRNDRDTARFMLSQAGRYEYVLSSGSFGGTVETEFFTRMRTMPGVPELEAVLCKLAGWDEPTAAEERLVSALHWFGEAWKEDLIEAKIVKFAMCLESLLMTGAKEGLTELLSERIALMLGTDYSSRLKYFIDAKAMYDARSRAVHGDMAGTNLDFAQASRTAEELASGVIFTYAQIVPALNRVSELRPALADFFTALKLGGLNAGRAHLQQLVARASS